MRNLLGDTELDFDRNLGESDNNIVEFVAENLIVGIFIHRNIKTFQELVLIFNIKQFFAFNAINNSDLTRKLPEFLVVYIPLAFRVELCPEFYNIVELIVIDCTFVCTKRFFV